MAISNTKRMMPRPAETLASPRRARAMEARPIVRDLAHRAGLTNEAPRQRHADTVEFTQTRRMQSFARSLAIQNEGVPDIVKLQKAIQTGTYGVDADGIAEKMLADRDFVAALTD